MLLNKWTDVSLLTEAQVQAVKDRANQPREGPPVGRQSARKTRELLQEECNICYKPFGCGDEVRWFECPHAFHTTCIDTWLQKARNTCPLCQHPIGPQRMARRSTEHAAHQD